jgi:hypothetical protein
MDRRIVGICLATLLSFTLATAQGEDKEKKEQGSGPSPYVECGIGAALFPNTGWAAATSNVTWDLGITAITSALSSPEMCNAKKVATARLILETLPSLEKDLAVSEGKYLVALNQTMSCSPDAHKPINADLRVAYAEVVSEKGYVEKSRVGRAADLYESVRLVVAANPASCDIVL